MANTFIRKYHLTVYKPIPKSFGSRGRRTTVAYNAGQYILENYRIQGTFRFSSAGVASTADSHTISIYNAPYELVSFLREPGIKVELRAGYENDNGVNYADSSSLPLVYKGEKVKSKTYRDGLNTVTDILMSTALTEKREAITSQFFPGSEPLESVIKKLASPMEIPTVVILGEEDAAKSLRKGMHIYGNAATEIQKLANSYGLVHWYQNETLYVGSARSLSIVNPKNTLYKIHPGRIKGIVNWSTDDTVKAKGADPSLKADFTTFLIPGLEIGNSVELEIDGDLVTLVVTSLEHELDTHGDLWDTRIVAEAEVN